MSLLISGDLRLAQTYTRPDDADAVAYIAAVEAADGQALETATRMAINSFVKGCKNDGIWTAIKASCILAGARTLTGALIPLAGTAPTNFNFVDGDYNRKTGLVGDGSTKYLNSNRNNNADPQDSKHIAAFISTLSTVNASVQIGVSSGATTGRSAITWFTPPNQHGFRNNNGSSAFAASAVTGLSGCSRNLSGSFLVRTGSVTTSKSANSEVPLSESIGVFGITTNSLHSNARLAFYSIGESLNLALLDTRVTDLINAFAAAIP
jgi:hypothetical protein